MECTWRQRDCPDLSCITHHGTEPGRAELAGDRFADPGIPSGIPSGNAAGSWFIAPGAGSPAGDAGSLQGEPTLLPAYATPFASRPNLDPYGATSDSAGLRFDGFDLDGGHGLPNRPGPRWFRLSRGGTPGSTVRLMGLVGLLGITLLVFDARMGGDIGDTVVVPTAMSSAAFRASITPSTPRVQCVSGSQVSTGTGFAIEPTPGNLVVVTAAHVVAGCEGGGVALLFGRTRIEGVVIGSDAAHDIAVISTGYPLPPLAMGGVPESGDPVVVVGYPGGAPTAAVLVGRVNEVSSDELLMRVVVSPGVSGSPVVDEQHGVVGIVTADVQASLVETGVATRLDVLCRDLVRC